MSTALALILLLPPLFLLLHRRRRSNSVEGRLPPSPGAGLPVLGHLLLLGELPHRTLRALVARHGPVILLRLGGTRAVVVSTSAAAQEALKDRSLAFAGRPALRAAEKLFYGRRDMGFAPHGEYWRHVRRACVRGLFSQSSVNALREIREEEVSVLVDKVDRLSFAGPVNLSELLISLTNGIICRAALGRRRSTTCTLSGVGNVSLLFSELVQMLGKPSVGDLIPSLSWVDRLTGLEGRVRRLHDTMDAFLEEVIAEHRSKQSTSDDDGGDFVDFLLEVQRRRDGLELSDSDVKAVVMDMFAAGTDPTYTAMEWTMAELVRHPEEMKKAQQEVRTAVGATARGTAVAEADAGKLTYLQAVIKESLRLHPPSPLLLPRETTEDTELLGYRIPARTWVMINAWAIARDPGSWDSPEEFRPGRFVGSLVDYYRGNNFELIPFGAGRRMCPAVAFAPPIMEVALASLLYHFDWELPEGRAGETLDVSEAAGLDVHLKSHLVLVAKPWLPGNRDMHG